VPITQTAPQLTQPIQPAATPNASVAQTQPSQEPQQAKKKRGFFGRLFGGKKDDDQNQAQPAPQPNPPPPPQ
jgi:hypothetical protein